MFLPLDKGVRLLITQIRIIVAHLLPASTSTLDLFIQLLDHISLTDVYGIILQQLHLDEDIGNLILDKAVAKTAKSEACQILSSQPLVARHRFAVDSAECSLPCAQVVPPKKTILGIRSEEDDKTKDDRDGY